MECSRNFIDQVYRFYGLKTSCKHPSPLFTKHEMITKPKTARIREFETNLSHVLAYLIETHQENFTTQIELPGTNRMMKSKVRIYQIVRGGWEWWEVSSKPCFRERKVERVMERRPFFSLMWAAPSKEGGDGSMYGRPWGELPSSPLLPLSPISPILIFPSTPLKWEATD